MSASGARVIGSAQNDHPQGGCPTLVTMILYGLHVLFAILWVGGDMFSNFVVIPAANGIDPVHANAFLGKFGKAAERYMGPVGALTILFGILLGWKLGAWGNIGYAYGNTYLSAMVLAIAVYLWGILMLGRNIKKAMSFGIGTPEFVAIVDKVKKYSGIQLIGFLGIFILMVLMRFGL